MFVKLSEPGAIMKKLTIVFIVTLAFVSTACNTVQGIGKDIEKGGQAIEKVAK
jgi:predicted small secreted protein